MIGAGHAQLEHAFQIAFGPPGAGELESVLDDMAMAALYFARSNGQVAAAGSGIVQMFKALSQVWGGGGDGAFFDAQGFDVFFQAAQDGAGAIVQEPPLLTAPPSSFLARRHGEGGGGQIFADMVEVDQIGALAAKVLGELIDDPRREPL